MSKYKYRYKCMTCGTEQVVGEEMTACGACGSDSLVRLEIGPETAEVKPARRNSPRRKAAPKTPPKASPPDVARPASVPFDALRECWYCGSMYDKALDLCPKCGRSSVGPSAPYSVVPPAAKADDGKKPFWRRMLSVATAPARFAVSLLRRVKWSVVFRILAPLLIGAGVYCVLKGFI